MKDKADYSLDVRGTISPFSLLKVSLVFQEMDPNEIVEILGCDSEMQSDLVRILSNENCEIVHMDPAENNPDIEKVWLRKKRHATDK